LAEVPPASPGGGHRIGAVLAIKNHNHEFSRSLEVAQQFHNGFAGEYFPSEGQHAGCAGNISLDE